MLEVTALFWDVGGVVLSNGWDREERAAAIKHFGLDAEAFEERHELVNTAFEQGRMNLDTYLEQTVFYCPRTFSQEEFKSFLFAQSTENHGTRAVLDEVTAAGRYLLATLNNESAELNAFRIRHFQLTRNFTAFFTSCYLGVRKPDSAIYRLALDITQRAPEECIFIDDRQLNLECARRLGMRAIHFQNPQQLARDLMHEGVRGAAA
jgi:putative hydrolase of the HAD superfamily